MDAIDPAGEITDALLGTARDRPEVLVAGLLALLVVSWPASWRLTRGVVTIAHEGGHALAAVLTGRGLHGIRLHADSSGVTHSSGRGGGVGLVLTLTQVRNAFGVVSVLLTGGVVGAVAWWGDAALQAGFAAALAWFLLFGGLRAVRELQRSRRRGPTRFGGESDAEALARLSGVPGGMWAGLFWLLATTSVIAGAWVLVGGVA